jgi:hypothetical protein
MVREWLEGRSLAAYLAERREKRASALSVREAIGLLDSAADALAYAHAESVEHHSLTPQNLFVAETRRGGVVKVLDFGTAPSFDTRATRPGGLLDDRGLRLMFSSYAAPEQLDRSLGEPCAATDVYTFALIFFETLTGRPYFAATMHPNDVLAAATSKQRRAPTGGATIPRELDSVLRRALSPRPADRHTNIGVFWDDVQRAVRAPAPKPVIVRSTPAPVVPRRELKSATVTRFTLPPKELSWSPPPPSSPPPPPQLPPPAQVVSPPAQVSPALPVAARPRVPTLLEFPAPPSRASFVTPPPVAAPVESWTGQVAPPVTTIPRAAYGEVHADVSPTPDPSTAPTARRPRRFAAWAAAACAAMTIAGIVLVAGVRREERSIARQPNRTAHAPVGVSIENAPLFAKRRTVWSEAAQKQALAAIAADLQTCAVRYGPRGPGTVRIVILPNGHVRSVQIGPPYTKSRTGQCIRERFFSAELPSFDGSPHTLDYVFLTIPF